MKEKKLIRPADGRMIFGVAEGLGDYLNIDPVIVRLLFVLLAIAGGPGILLYLIMTVVIPGEDVPEPMANGFDEDEIVIKGA